MPTLATWALAASAISSVTLAVDSATRGTKTTSPAARPDTEERLAADPGLAPPRLADTGLYEDFATQRLHPGVLPFSPQYPLWTDGARKRRWIWLPPGTTIDASEPRSWRFPAGTKLWKEFAYERRVETRFMELTASGWIYATYVWTEDGTDAVLAPARGVPAPYVRTSGDVRHDIPGVQDCKACHQGREGEVLGFELLQLSPDRDPLSPHATSSPGDVNLRTLADGGLLRGMPAELLEDPPRVAARTPRERAALGYLHGNCSSCHNASGPLASMGLSLVAPIATGESAGNERGARETAVGVDSRFRPPGTAQPSLRIAPGAPERSVLVQRMSSRHAAVQMPPLGTSVVDEDAVRLVTGWVRELPGRAISMTTQSTR
jgi:hypothetical protein